LAHVIVSYDGTRNDRDALALGSLFAAAGAEVSLAYVRHAAEKERERELAVHAEAERLLAAGAATIPGASVGQHIVLHPSTAEGLAALAEQVGADVIVFGSSYRTPHFHIEVPQTASLLLERPVSFSIAIAPAGLRREPIERSIGTVRLVDEDADGAARSTAASLAHALGAILIDDDADLLLVASRPDAPPGKLLLSGAGRELLGEATCPVLALARGTELSFG
jgi:nucleotide-binding universal stress UspA family protein